MFITNAYADGDTIKIQQTQQPAPQQSAVAGLESSWTSMVPMVLIFVVFYFLLIRPQEKKRKQQEEMVGSVKRGEEVITNGGIFGTVSRVNESDNIVELEIAKDTHVKILKSAIVDIISRKKLAEAAIASEEKKTKKSGK